VVVVVAMVMGLDNGHIGGVSPIFFDAIVNVVTAEIIGLCWYVYGGVGYIPLASPGQAHFVHITVINVVVDMVMFMLNNWLINGGGTNHCVPAGVVECTLGIDGGDCRHAILMNMW